MSSGKSWAVRDLVVVVCSLALLLAGGVAARALAGSITVFTEPSLGVSFRYDQTRWVPTLLTDNGAAASDGVAQRTIGLANQDERAWLIIAAFNNSADLSGAMWLDQYDYPRTDASIDTSFGKVGGQPAVILSEIPAQYTGTPANLRAVVAANQRIYLIEYASLNPNRAQFEDFLSGIVFTPPTAFQPAALKIDLAMSFADNGLTLKASSSQDPAAPTVGKCCGVSDPEYNPFPCNSSQNKGNCTWWARYRRTGDNRANLYACTGNANTWDDCAAQHYPDLVSNSPTDQDVIVWMRSGENHVAYIERMNSNSTYYVSQMGWSQTCPQSYYNYSRSDLKFLRHPNKLLPAPYGYLDRPAPNVSVAGVRRIDGWAKVNGSAIDHIEILIDGRYRGNAIYGTPRPDAGGNVGYYFDWDTAWDGNGIHQLQARAVAANGKTAELANSQSGSSSTPVNVQNTLTACSRVPLYRYYRAGTRSHFYTRLWSELGAGTSEWQYEGVQAFVFPQLQGTSTIPLHRLWNNTSQDHFYTTRADEVASAQTRGYAYEGINAYVLPDGKYGGIPLHRYYHGGFGKHFYTTSWDELGGGRDGWTYEGAIGYVFDSPAGCELRNKHVYLPLMRK